MSIFHVLTDNVLENTLTCAADIISKSESNTNFKKDRGIELLSVWQGQMCTV